MQKIEIWNYFKQDNRNYSSRDWQEIERIRAHLNSFQDEYDAYKWIYDRRQSQFNCQEDSRLFGIPIDAETGLDWIHKTNIYYNPDDQKIAKDGDIPKLDYKKRDSNGRIKYNKDGTEKEYGNLSKKGINFINNLMRTKAGRTVFFFINHFKLCIVGIIVFFLLVVGTTSIIYIGGIANSIGHTPFVLCGQDEIVGTTSVQIPSAKVEEAAKPEYAMKAIISMAKERGWKDNAIVGTLSYMLAEGSGMGTFTYEDYYCVKGPNGVLFDKGLNNQQWLTWLHSDSTLARYNEVYYAAHTSRYAAIGLGLTQESDVYNYKGGNQEDGGATKLVKAAIDAGKPWQDPLWQCTYLIDTIFPEHQNDSDYIDPKTYTGSADEYCRRVTTFIGMPGWHWTDNNKYMTGHVAHINEAKKIFADFTGVDIDSLDEQTTNPCEGANSLISGGNSTIADAAVSLASGDGGQNKIPWDQDGANSPNLNDQRLKLYKDKHIELLGSGDIYFASCDRSAATAIRWSEADKTFPAGPTSVQYNYLLNSPKWSYVGDYGSAELKPGDVLITKGDGHIKIYVGTEAVQKRFPGSTSDMYAGSFHQYFPILYKDNPSYDSRVYAVFRNVKSDKEQ